MPLSFTLPLQLYSLKAVFALMALLGLCVDVYLVFKMAIDVVAATPLTRPTYKIITSAVTAEMDFLEYLRQSVLIVDAGPAGPVMRIPFNNIRQTTFARQFEPHFMALTYLVLCLPTAILSLVFSQMAPAVATGLAVLSLARVVLGPQMLWKGLLVIWELSAVLYCRPVEVRKRLFSACCGFRCRLAGCIVGFVGTFLALLALIAVAIVISIGVTSDAKELDGQQGYIIGLGVLGSIFVTVGLGFLMGCTHNLPVDILVYLTSLDQGVRVYFAKPRKSEMFESIRCCAGDPDAIPGAGRCDSVIDQVARKLQIAPRKATHFQLDPNPVQESVLYVFGINDINEFKESLNMDTMLMRFERDQRKAMGFDDSDPEEAAEAEGPGILNAAIRRAVSSPNMRAGIEVDSTEAATEAKSVEIAIQQEQGGALAQMTLQDTVRAAHAEAEKQPEMIAADQALQDALQHVKLGSISSGPGLGFTVLTKLRHFFRRRSRAKTMDEAAAVMVPSPKASEINTIRSTDRTDDTMTSGTRLNCAFSKEDRVMDLQANHTHTAGHTPPETARSAGGDLAPVNRRHIRRPSAVPALGRLDEATAGDIDYGLDSRGDLRQQSTRSILKQSHDMQQSKRVSFRGDPTASRRSGGAGLSSKRSQFTARTPAINKLGKIVAPPDGGWESYEVDPGFTVSPGAGSSRDSGRRSVNGMLVPPYDAKPRRIDTSAPPDRRASESTTPLTARHDAALASRRSEPPEITGTGRMTLPAGTTKTLRSITVNQLEEALPDDVKQQLAAVQKNFQLTSPFELPGSGTGSTADPGDRSSDGGGRSSRLVLSAEALRVLDELTATENPEQKHYSFRLLSGGYLGEEQVVREEPNPYFERRSQHQAERERASARAAQRAERRAKREAKAAGQSKPTQISLLVAAAKAAAEEGGDEDGTGRGLETKSGTLTASGTTGSVFQRPPRATPYSGESKRPESQGRTGVASSSRTRGSSAKRSTSGRSEQASTTTTAREAEFGVKKSIIPATRRSAQPVSYRAAKLEQEAALQVWPEEAKAFQDAILDIEVAVAGTYTQAPSKVQ